MKKISKIILIMAIILLAGGSALWAANQYYASDIMYNKNGTQITVEAALNELDSKIPYKITYDANGGSGSMGVGAKYAEQSYSVAGCAFTAPTGKYFKSWNTNASGTGTNYAPGAAYTANAGTTLYAIWEKSIEPGDYVNLGTNLLDKNIALEDGSKPKTDWRVFYKESGGIILMMSDYLPYSANTTVGSGLRNDSSYPYNWKSDTNRADLITRLTNIAVWNKLIPGTLIGKGASVTGALDLNTWVRAWNSMVGYTKLYTNTYYNKNGALMSDNLDGYYVGTSANPTSDSQTVSSTAGYGNTLFFPHKKSTVNSSTVYGYWLASPSANGTNYVMTVYYDGSVGNYILLRQQRRRASSSLSSIYYHYDMGCHKWILDSKLEI